MIFVNGVATDHVAATDRGLAYGDGVFRTLSAGRGRPRWWSRHYRKLAGDCAALGISCPPESSLKEEVARAAARSGDAVVKIVITRGSGPRGYALPPEPAPTRIVMTAPAPVYAGDFGRLGVEIRLCRIRLASQPLLAGIKHLNRLENVLARAEWNDPAVPEGLMLDEEGNVIGGTLSNLFLSERGSLVTPVLARCGVAGVARDIVMEAAAKQGVACREEPVSQARLLGADEVFLVNSVIGLWPVRRLAGHGWETGMCTVQARKWLDEEERD